MQPARGFDPGALRRIRQRCGLTQAELAEQMGVKRTYALTWERQGPDGTGPSPPTLVRLAAVLDVEPHQLTTIAREEALLGDLRQWRGLSQEELAEQTGIASSTIAALELATRPLQDHQAEAIAEALDLSPAEVQAAYKRAAHSSNTAPGR